MKKLLLLFLGLFCLFSQETVYSQAKSMDPSELEVLRSVVMSDTIPTVYFKTIVSDLNQPLSRQLFYLTDFDVCNFLVNQDSMALSREERSYLAERFTTMETGNINKLVRDPKNYSLKDMKGHDWFQISLPVVFREGNYAIYYAKTAYSGQFILMKKIDGVWSDVCYSAVWSE